MAYSKAKGSSKLLLAELAALQDKYGAPVFPSMITLSLKSGISERHIQTVIKSLERQGHIAVVRKKEPGKRPRNYYIVLTPWKTSQSTAQMITEVPAQMITEPSAVNRDELRDLDLKPKIKIPSISPQYPTEQIPSFVKFKLGIDPQSPFGRVLCNGALPGGGY